jgi:putative nucleotidyltransferase with HDIG domain
MGKKIFFLVAAFSGLFASSAFDEFAGVYARHGHIQYLPDEEITQLGHILEAASIASMLGAPEEVIVGLLLHDVGRMFAADGEAEGDAAHYSHDDVGGAWAEENGFPSLTADCIRNHTLVKLILCEEDPSYYENLSPISKISYQIQKKKFLEGKQKARLIALRESGHQGDFKAFRLCDDMAKLKSLDPLLSSDAPISSLEAYREMITRVISGEGLPAKNPKWHEKARQWHNMRTKDRASFEHFLLLKHLEIRA